VDALDAKGDAVVAELREQRQEMREQRQEMKAGFERVDERFERVDERFERLHRLMVQFCGVAIAALVGLIATQV
jgi:hypothetical protein